MKAYFQKLLTECSNEEVLEKLQCNVVVLAIEYKYSSRFDKDVWEEFIDIQNELLKRMNK